MEHSTAQNEIVKFNVGGTTFFCYRQILSVFPESKLANLDKIDLTCEDNNTYFFDRNPVLFAHILDGYRKGTIHLPRDVCGITLKDELNFWDLAPHYVAPCCLEILYRGEDEEMTMKILMDTLQRISHTQTDSRQNPDFRTRIWLFLDEPKSSRSAMVTVFFTCLPYTQHLFHNYIIIFYIKLYAFLTIFIFIFSCFKYYIMF